MTDEPVLGPSPQARTALIESFLRDAANLGMTAMVLAGTEGEDGQPHMSLSVNRRGALESGIAFLTSVNEEAIDAVQAVLAKTPQPRNFQQTRALAKACLEAARVKTGGIAC
jgi:hypothetical protein